MKLTSPFPISTIVQPFGANAVSAYADMGLKGHPGIDYQVPWGTPIPSTSDGICYSLLGKKMGVGVYHAVCTIIDDVDFSYEVIYGHCSEMYPIPVQNVSKGQIIGTVGNTGDVYQNGKLVSNAEKNAGSRAGSHLHFQVRRLIKTPVNGYIVGKHYINDGHGLMELNGFNYYVPEYDNGHNGCIDPMQFFDTSFQFTRNLWLGMKNNDVLELQKRLGVIQTGLFGTLTFSAVRAYQKAHAIPTTGFVGPLTRANLNSTV